MSSEIAINYTEAYTDPEDRYIAALADTRRYIGEEMWGKFIDHYHLGEGETLRYDLSKLENRQSIRKNIRGVCSLFWGVKGYPVECLIKLVFRTHMSRARAKE